MLQFQVENQTLSLLQGCRLVEGARDFVRFSVKFSEEWDGYFIIMRFWREGEVAHEVADVKAGREYYLPHSVLSRAGSFYVTCLGVKGEHSLATASRLRLDVEANELPEEAKPVTEADPTLLSEVVRLLEETGKSLSLAKLSFRKNETHLQWKYESEADAAYRDFIALSAISGADGEAGEGIVMLREADADRLTKPGIYCVSGKKMNFPYQSGDSNASRLLLVQEMQNSFGKNSVVQIAFGMEEEADGAFVYSRQFGVGTTDAWSEWTFGLYLAEESVRERHLSREVSLPVRTCNLLEPAGLGTVFGQYLDTDGTFKKNSDYCTSPFLPVEAGKYVYRRLHTSNMIMSGAYYNREKEFIRAFGSAGFSAQNVVELEFEEEGFVRLSYRSIDPYPHYHMFAKGDSSTPFLPYHAGLELFSGKSAGFGEGLLMDIEQTAVGRYNSFIRGGRTHNTAFVVGNGASDASRSNALRIDYQGRTYATGAYNSSGADYAEYFEWADGGEAGDARLGRLVSLCGEKIKLAEAGDAIVGVVSALPSVLSDAASDAWHGRYQKDVFGRILYEEDSRGRLVPRESEEFDPLRAYVAREERCEWAPIGLLGKLVLTDDGSLAAGDFVTSLGAGIGTKSEEKTGVVVLSRLDETHVRVLVK